MRSAPAPQARANMCARPTVARHGLRATTRFPRMRRYSPHRRPYAMWLPAAPPCGAPARAEERRNRGPRAITAVRAQSAQGHKHIDVSVYWPPEVHWNTCQRKMVACIRGVRPYPMEDRAASERAMSGLQKWHAHDARANEPQGHWPAILHKSRTGGRIATGSQSTFPRRMATRQRCDGTFASPPTH